MDLQEEISELKETLRKAVDELSYQAKRFCRRPEEAVPTDWTSDCTEVAALSRPLNLGMLYDCCSDSFFSDQFLWDEGVISSLRLSLPWPHTDVRVLVGDSLQERFRALDVSLPLRATVLSGLIEVGGAAGYLNHTPRSLQQDHVTLHYRATSRLEMLSQSLIQGQAPLRLTNQNKATHVVMAVLYGAQAFFVFKKDSDSSDENGGLENVIKKMTSSFSAVKEEVLFGSCLTESERLNTLLYDCVLYSDVGDFKSPMNFETAVKVYKSFPKLLGSQGDIAVPLKVWLCPLKNIDPTFVRVVREIRDDLLHRAVNVVEQLRNGIRMSKYLMDESSSLSVMAWFPILQKKLTQFYELLKQYQSEFQGALATSIQTIREGGKEGEENLRDMLERNDRSPFSPQNVQQWIHNKQTEIKALNDCRDANITIIKSHKQLNQIIRDPQTNRVLCFALTSLERKDPFLKVLTQYIHLVNRFSMDRFYTTHPFKLPDWSQKILSDLQLFKTSKDNNEDSETTKYIATSTANDVFLGSSILLYQAGSVVSQCINLGVKPDPAVTIQTKQTSVTVRLQKTQNLITERYRIEYRAVSSGAAAPRTKAWDSVYVSSPEGTYTLFGLKAGSKYELRYSVIHDGRMSDCSRIITFQAQPRLRPGQPKARRLNKSTISLDWQRPESEEGSPVLYYMVWCKEAGLDRWSSKQTEGPQCECTVTFPHSACYRVRVSAVYGEGDTSEPSEETDIPVDVWYIDLTERKASLFLEVLKLQKEKKPMQLRDKTMGDDGLYVTLPCNSSRSVYPDNEISQHIPYYQNQAGGLLPGYARTLPTGAYDKNPFAFKHYDLEFLAAYVDGQQFRAKPLQPEYRE
ncbi:neoverrucotoxin subunit alpha-like [Chanos chanos]|uniref:Neoverrucotoxin subunit alpha-like n=1 Tax=Chanos chanos TaxID=29144 RepID=A0A6J2WDS2_CHACN|nr:neoverrucotoxin subunit alpha-like [Chanos chanos]